jgi:hypothetical protein
MRNLGVAPYFFVIDVTPLAVLHGLSVALDMGFRRPHASGRDAACESAALCGCARLGACLFEGSMAKQKTGRRPALNRRVVLYDLNDAERAKLKELADKDNRTISRWVADAVRAAMKARD